MSRHDAAVARSLACAAESGRATAEAGFRAALGVPEVPCAATGCRRGVVVATDGTQSMCGACRGHGHRIITVPEARRAYARLRAATCAARGMAPRDFDAAVRHRAGVDEPSPGLWLRAAIGFAASLGVSP